MRRSRAGGRCVLLLASLVAVRAAVPPSAARAVETSAAPPVTDAAAAPAPGREVPADAVLAELPFLASDDVNRVFVDLAPDGSRPLRLLLDTGASDSVLTPLYARSLGVSVRALKSEPYRRPTRLGRDLQFWIDTRTSDSGSKTGWEYGLLGGRFLAEYVLEIDFPNRRVRFLDARRFEVPKGTDVPGEAVVPLQVVGARPHVEVEIGGERVTLLLDTGDPFGLTLSGKIAARTGIDAKDAPGLASGSVWGPVDVQFAEVASARLGPFDLGVQPVLVAPRGWYNMGGSTDSALGYDVLAGFVVRLDYARQRMWLRRVPGVETTFLGIPYTPSRRAGVLCARQRGGLRVQAVLPGGPAERLGVLPGDVIESPPDADVASFAAKALETIAAGRGITVARETNEVWMDVALPDDAPVAVSAGEDD